MPLRAGIVGLPNVGKSTLFNALTKSGAEAANYPFCTIDPNVGIVEVPDDRIAKLAEIVKPQRVVYSTVEFVDIAGLARGASKGEGLGNQFLGHIREVDAIIHVCRGFQDGDIVHVHGKIDPIDDIEVVDLELIYADIDSIDRQRHRLEKAVRGDKKLQPKLDVCDKLKAALEAGKPARSVELTPEERADSRDLFLLTAKPVLYCCNVSEEEAADASKNPFFQKVAARAAAEGAEAIAISAKVESEIIQLAPDEREMFLGEMGLAEPGLNRLIRKTYDLLGLVSFMTAGEKEVRSWTIQKGWKAPKAASVIHTDFEKGFIRVEATSYDDFVAHKGLAGAKEAGKMRLEGKDYVVQDGDVCLFRVST